MRRKFGNKITYIGDIKFDSKSEANYYLILLERQRRGEISNLRRQVPYELIPKITEEREEVKHLKTKDKIVRKQVTIQSAVRYIADFVYVSNNTGKEHVVDVKGKTAPLTKEFLLKQKMMRYLLGITVEIVRM